MYSKPFISLAICASVFLAAPVSVSADSVIRTGETISIDSNQKIDGDFYAAASILNLSGAVSEDMSAVGGKVTLNGSVGKDALLVGGNVDVHGAVGDDLRIVGGDIIIAEPITGDVFVFARTVTILDTASIGGDLIVYSKELEVSGSVGGDVIGSVETARVDAAVAGNVDVAVGMLTVGDKANITGTLKYASQETIIRSPNAKVGEIIRNDPVTKQGGTSAAKFASLTVLSFLFSVLVWYLVARNFLTHIVDRALVRGIRPTATGFIAFLAAPVVIVVLTVSVLGTLVGLTALAAYMFAVLLSIISSAAVVGQLVVRTYKKNATTLTPLTLCIGVSVITVTAMIPYVGLAAIMLLFVVTLGALVDIVLHPNKS